MAKGEFGIPGTGPGGTADALLGSRAMRPGEIQMKKSSQAVIFSILMAFTAIGAQRAHAGEDSCLQSIVTPGWKTHALDSRERAAVIEAILFIRDLGYEKAAQELTEKLGDGKILGDSSMEAGFYAEISPPLRGPRKIRVNTSGLVTRKEIAELQQKIEKKKASGEKVGVLMGELQEKREAQLKFASVLFHEWFHTQQSQVGMQATALRSARMGDNAFVELPAWEAQSKFLSRAAQAFEKAGSREQARMAAEMSDWAMDQARERHLSHSSRELMEHLYGLSPQCDPSAPVNSRKIASRVESAPARSQEQSGSKPKGADRRPGITHSGSSL